MITIESGSLTFDDMREVISDMRNVKHCEVLRYVQPLRRRCYRFTVEFPSLPPMASRDMETEFLKGAIIIDPDLTVRFNG